MIIEKPKLSKNINNRSINDEEIFLDMEFRDEKRITSIEDKEWNGCIFKSIDFSNVSLKNIDIIDCIFEDCDLSNIQLGNTLIRCQFKNCKLLGLIIDESTCKNIYFENCILDFSAFSDSKLDKIVMNNVSLKEVRLYNIQHNNLEFIDSNLNNIEIINTKLKGIDLSSCNIEKIKFRKEDLEGVILGINQLVDVVSQLGIIIK